jgi:hypothetical protein
MDQEPQQPTPNPGTSSPAVWLRLRQQAARVPTRAWVVMGLFFIAALLMALHTALVDKSASLHLKVQHSFRSAQVSVWVDSDLAYSGKLTGYLRKKFGLLPGSVQGSLSEFVPVSSGSHVIRVQVTADDGSVQEESISGEFVRNTERNLSVVVRPGNVSLAWQGAGSLPMEAASSTGWISRYANTLFLTAAGSIISALAGFAVRELPAQIRARQNQPAKAQSATAGR